MENLQWNKFVKKIYINTSIEELFNLWSTRKGISSWFVKDAEFISGNGTIKAADESFQSGDTYTWFWHNCDATEVGKVIDSNGKDYFELSFAKSKVAVKLKSENNSTLVILTQFEIPEDEKSKLQIYTGCSNGWTFWLANLKSFVEHGVLLHETKLDLTNPDYSGYEFVNM